MRENGGGGGAVRKQRDIIDPSSLAAHGSIRLIVGGGKEIKSEKISRLRLLS